MISLILFQKLRYPVLIILDEINYFFKTSTTIIDPISTQTSYRTKGIVPVDHLVVPQIFVNLNHGLINGTLLASTSAGLDHKEFLQRTNLKEKDLIKVPSLSRSEVRLLVDWFEKNGLVLSRNFFFLKNFSFFFRILKFLLLIQN